MFSPTSKLTSIVGLPAFCRRSNARIPDGLVIWYSNLASDEEGCLFPSGHVRVERCRRGAQLKNG
jgi:hypothetical protein